MVCPTIAMGNGKHQKFHLVERQFWFYFAITLA
jgi:hypothetical protein